MLAACMACLAWSGSLSGAPPERHNRIAHIFINGAAIVVAHIDQTARPTDVFRAIQQKTHKTYSAHKCLKSLAIMMPGATPNYQIATSQDSA